MKAVKLREAQERAKEDKVFTIRVGRLPPSVKNQEVIDVFAAYGEIKGFTRPTNMDKQIPCPYAFIKYKDESAAQEAIAAMDNAFIWDVDLSVQDANHQASFFSKNTGGLIDHESPFPDRQDSDFDSSMPYNHYQLKREEQLRNSDNVFTVKVEDLHPEVSKEMLMEIFGQFGEIASIYHPVDLKHSCRPLGIAFIRYTSPRSAEAAVQHMHGINLGIGRDLVVTMSHNHSYFSQDESYFNPKKWVSKEQAAAAAQIQRTRQATKAVAFFIG